MTQISYHLSTLLISALLLFFNKPVYSQKSEITWGQESDITVYKKTKFIGNNENLFYSYETSKKLIHVNKLSLTNSSESTRKEVRLPIINGYESEFFDLILIETNLYLFSRIFDKSTGINALYATMLNSDGSLTSEPKLIDEIKLTKETIGDSYFELSKNETKLCLCRYEPKYEDNPEKYIFKILDKDLKTSWTKTLEIPVDKEIYYTSFTLDKNDNLVLWAGNVKTKQEAKKGGTPYTLSLLFYNHTSTLLSETPISLNEQFLIGSKLDISRNGKVVFAGTYADEPVKKGKDTKIKGMFCFVLKPDGQSLESGILRDLKADLPDEKLLNYKFKDIQYTDDGRIFLITEQYDTYRVTRQISQAEKERHMKVDPDAVFESMNEYGAFYHLYDKIIVGCFGSTQFNWAKKITKFQMVENPGQYSFAGFIAVPNGDDLHLILNKTKSDVESEKPLTSKPKLLASKIMLSPPVTLIYKIDKQGNITENKVFSESESEIAIRCNMAFQLKNKGVIFIGKTPTKEKFGTLLYK